MLFPLALRRDEGLEGRRDVRPATAGDLRARAAEHLVRALTIRAAGAKDATAALDTVKVVSDPTHLDPRTFGYVGSLSSEETRVATEGALPEILKDPEITWTSEASAIGTPVIDAIDALAVELSRPDEPAVPKDGSGAKRIDVNDPASPDWRADAPGTKPVSPNGANQQVV